MMMMTIWWSKATRLLEFSRSLQGSVDLEHAAEKRGTFCVTGGQAEELGILVVGFYCENNFWNKIIFAVIVSFTFYSAKK